MTIYVRRMVTARNAVDGSIIDLTETRWTTEERNEKLDGARTRRRHHIDLVCRDCGGGVNYHFNSHGTFWLQHNPGEARRCLTRDIQPNGESPAHFAAKFALARTLRLNGWNADPERRFEGNGVVVKPDVYAWHEHNPAAHQRPTDWEIQLTDQSLGVFITRTQEHLDASGHRTAWVTPFDSDLDCQLGVVTDPTGLYIAGRVYESASEEVPLATMTVSGFVAKTQKRRPELIWADAGSGNKWIAYPPGQKPTVDTPAPPPVADDLVVLDRHCERIPANPVTVPPPATIPLPQPVVRFSGVEPFPSTAPNQARRTSSGRYEIGDLIRNRITGRHGEVIEVFGQRTPVYRMIDDDGIWPVADRHAERFLGGADVPMPVNWPQGDVS